MDVIVKIYRKESLLFAITGLIVAFLFLSFMGGMNNAIKVIGEFFLNFFIAITGLLISVWITSGYLGRRNNKINPYFAAFLITYMSLIAGVLFGSLVGFYEEGQGEISAIYDYILKPLILVLMFGSIPSIFLALGLGYRLKKTTYNKV